VDSFIATATSVGRIFYPALKAPDHPSEVDFNENLSGDLSVFVDWISKVCIAFLD
jgi:hypothetical protein